MSWRARRLRVHCASPGLGTPGRGGGPRPLGGPPSGPTAVEVPLRLCSWPCPVLGTWATLTHMPGPSCQAPDCLEITAPQILPCLTPSWGPRSPLPREAVGRTSREVTGLCATPKSLSLRFWDSSVGSRWQGGGKGHLILGGQGTGGNWTLWWPGPASPASL